MDLQTLYLIAKSCKEYSDFCTYLGKYINIPSTDARCLSITLEDLMDKNLKALSESQSVSDNEDKRKNCRGYDKECNERFKDGFDCRNCFYY